MHGFDLRCVPREDGRRRPQDQWIHRDVQELHELERDQPSFLGHVTPRYFDDPIEGCTSLQKIDVSSIDTSNVYIGNFGYIQNSQLYSITLSEYFNFREPEIIRIPDDPYDRGTMWVRVDESGNPVGQSLSTDALEEKYPGCGVGTYQWDTFRTIKFNLNGASGSAPDRKVNISGDIEFTVPEAVYPEHRLVGWKYKNTTIPVGKDGVAHLSKEEAQKLFGKNKSITLVAQWQEVFRHHRALAWRVPLQGTCRPCAAPPRRDPLGDELHRA